MQESNTLHCNETTLLKKPQIRLDNPRVPWKNGLTMGTYERLLRPLLFRLPPERAQAFADWWLRRRWLWRLGSLYFDSRDPRLHVTTAGLEFPSPVGLAAGYDKNCEFLGSLLNLGFGYAIGGTVVPQARRGNQRPRLKRLPRQRSLINALGFPGKGMTVVRENLDRLRSSGHQKGKPLVVSVAGLNLEEFQQCHAALELLADATELNISSPNTQGLRVFQEQETFKALLGSICAQRKKPIFVKIPPFANPQEQERVLALVRIAKEWNVDGITATNTRPVKAPEFASGQGGLSGSALLEDTLRIVAEVRAEAGPKMAINACGGIFTVNDTVRALRAGADTVQLLTALVYQGPSVARGINHGLTQLMQEQNCTSLKELIASKVSSTTASST